MAYNFNYQEEEQEDRITPDPLDPPIEELYLSQENQLPEDRFNVPEEAITSTLDVYTPHKEDAKESLPAGYDKGSWNRLAAAGAGVSEASETLVTALGSSWWGGVKGLFHLVTSVGEDWVTRESFSNDTLNWEQHVHESADIIRETQKAYTYSPKTEQGASLLNVMFAPFELFADNISRPLGEKANKELGPEAATAVDMLSAWAVFKGMQLTGRAILQTSKNIKDGAKTFVTGWGKDNKARILEEAADAQLVEDLSKSLVMKDSYKITVGKLEKADYLEKKLGIKLSLSEKLEDPVLASRQKRLAGMNKENMYKAEAHRESNRAAINSFVDDTFGSSSKGAAEVKNILVGAKGDIQNARLRLSQKLDDINSRRENLTRAIADDMTPEQMQKLGARWRALDEEEYVASRALVETMYAPIRNAKIEDVSEIMKTVKQYSTWSRFKDDSGNVLKSVRAMQQEMNYINSLENAKPTLNILRSWERLLGDDIAAYSQAGKKQVVMDLKALQAQVQKSMDSVADGKYGTQYKLAKETHKEFIEDRFKHGYIAAAREKVSSVRYAVDDEKVYKRLFVKGTSTKGGGQAAKDYINLYGDNPAAWEVMQDAALYTFKSEYLKQSAVVTDKMLAKFMEDYGSTLHHMPTIRQIFTRADSATKALNTMQAKVNLAQSKLDVSSFVRIMEKYTGGDDIANQVNMALKDPAAMRQLKARAKKAGVEAERGLARVIYDHVMARSKDKADSIDNLMFDSDWSASIKIGMSDDHFSALKALADYRRKEVYAEPPKAYKEAAVGIPEKIKDTFGMTPTSIISTWRNKNRLGISNVTVGSQVSASIITRISEKQAMQIEMLAMYDYDTARILKLLTASNTTVSAEIERGLHRALQLIGGNVYSNAPVAAGLSFQNNPDLREDVKATRELR